MNWLRPRVILTGLAGVGLLALLSLGQEVNRRWQYRQELAHLQDEANTLEAKVIELEHLNNYFRTDDYQERLAREKLNYRAPGEEVVLVPQEVTEEISARRAGIDEERQYSNPELWWRTLFVR